ncbi:tRNA-specific 2-thiouridylase [Desulfonema limicola]|uniref:tRNA-specific 2-thiouridylase MnmA n=1 Tax=Desulfonema limicola TaxID=45656 RepID=A0A975GHM0_9BACT|nr:tRNA 2-thiouridine(34) synthase MnmA [Desulfonema limicola]QTA81552.1 tRNA-specific 2-thiouridylase [Desulfonema limicola]
MPYIAVAVSGGIDSLAAAWIFKKKGCRLLGIHFTTGYESLNPKQVQHISDQLGIPVKIMDCTREFQNLVINYFINTYKSGKTPNPCLVCNPSIKFGAVFDFARSMNASSMATGHYAGIFKDSQGHYHLLQGKDLKKDQSYFLAFMSQTQLASACFPLGELTKEEVRKQAEEAGLSPPVEKESQDICFIRENYKDFLLKYGNIDQQPGIIEDVKGRVIGKHNGLYSFTIGQRKGINCPASEPYYVVRIDIKFNRLIVGFKDDLFVSQCFVKNINWITPPEKLPVSLHVRLRYRHKPVLALVSAENQETVRVEFDIPQSSVTPGQGAVFYKDNEVLGGGWIC